VKIRLTLIVLLLTLAASVGWGAPVTFDEISFLVRMRETDASISAQVSERRLLRALAPEQEAALKKQGVSETLLKTLRDPKLVVDEAEAAAFEKRRNERKMIASEAVVDSAPTAAPVIQADVVPSVPKVEPVPTVTFPPAEIGTSVGPVGPVGPVWPGSPPPLSGPVGPLVPSLVQPAKPIVVASASNAIMGTRDRAKRRALENFMTGSLTRPCGCRPRQSYRPMRPLAPKVALIVGIG